MRCAFCKSTDDLMGISLTAIRQKYPQVAAKLPSTFQFEDDALCFCGRCRRVVGVLIQAYLGRLKIPNLASLWIHKV